MPVKEPFCIDADFHAAGFHYRIGEYASTDAFV